MIKSCEKKQVPYLHKNYINVITHELLITSSQSNILSQTSQLMNVSTIKIMFSKSLKFNITIKIFQTKNRSTTQKNEQFRYPSTAVPKIQFLLTNHNSIETGSLIESN